MNNLKEIVEQLESCEYECEGGPLEMNTAFIELKKAALEGQVLAQPRRKFIPETQDGIDNSEGSTPCECPNNKLFENLEL
jgi:hypothetical protein